MENEFDELVEVLPFVIPLLLLQVALLVIALWDLVRRERVRGGSKAVWAVVIVFINIFGPIAYLLFGRLEGPPDAGNQD